MKYTHSLFLSAISLSFLSGTCDRQEDPAVYKDSTAVEFFRRTSGWVAGDGAFTVPLSDGSTLWLMGDSHINTLDTATGKIPCLFNVHNAGLVQPEGDWSKAGVRTLVSKEPGRESLFTDTAGHERWYWPVSGIQLKDTVYVYFTAVERATGGLGFAVTGKDKLVKLAFPEMKVVGYNSLPDFKGINFGVGFMEDPQSGYVYAFGHRYDEKTLQNDMYLARFRAEQPGGAWEYKDAEGWTPDPAKAVSIKKNAGFTPMVCKVKDKYLLVSSEASVGCDQGNEIYVSVSDHMTGPFSESKSIYTIDDTVQGHYPFFYVPVAHPQFINNKDEILITYNVNGYGTCVQGCVDNRMNPDHYRPRGIRVPLELIDPEL